MAQIELKKPAFKYDHKQNRFERSLRPEIREYLSEHLETDMNEAEFKYKKNPSANFLKLETEGLLGLLSEPNKARMSKTLILDLRPDGEIDEKQGQLYRPFELIFSDGNPVFNISYKDIQSMGKFNENIELKKLLEEADGGIFLACRYGTVSDLIQSKLIDYGKRGLVKNVSKYNVVDCGGLHDDNTHLPIEEIRTNRLFRELPSKKGLEKELY